MQFCVKVNLVLYDTRVWMRKYENAHLRAVQRIDYDKIYVQVFFTVRRIRCIWILKFNQYKTDDQFI